MNAIAGAGAYNDPSTSTAAPGAVAGAVANVGTYACARCHTTGVTLDTGVVSTTRPPDKTYPGINGYVNFDPDGDGPATQVSWATGVNTGQTLEGVQCERCHNASNHNTAAPPPPRGAAATALCLQCHRQEHTTTYTGNGLGGNIHPAPFSDNSAITLSEPTYTLPAIEVGRSDGSYAPVFFGYSTGMEFLNSVHAKFTGSFQQINIATKYNSGFSDGFCSLNGYKYPYDGLDGCEPAGGSWTDAKGCTFKQANCEENGGIWTVLQGGCTTCHDVHNSLFVDAQAGAALKIRCVDCHTGQTPGAGVPPQISLADIRHPQSAGTPFDTSKFDDLCTVCHMATQAVFNGDQISTPAHLWRINTSATYTTWPSMDQFNGTNGYTMDKRATMAPEAYSLPDGVTRATYTNAVWLDLDLACGQCHGGSKGAGATANGAMFKDKADLSNPAKNMHGLRAIGRFTAATDTVTSYAVNFDASESSHAITYDWNFGDGSTGTGNPISHTYVYSAATPTYTVILTLNNDVMVARTVAPTAVNRAPMVSGLLIPYSASTTNPTIVPGYAVSFIDGSTDADTGMGDVLGITVNWGDGTISIGSQGGTFPHTYARAGKYAITHYAKDSHNASKTERAYVKIVPPVYTIGGTVKNANNGPISYATVYLKASGHTRAIARADANGVYSLKNVPGGTYSVTALKIGYNPSFVSTGTVAGNVTGLDITLTPK